MTKIDIDYSLGRQGRVVGWEVEEEARRLCGRSDFSQHKRSSSKGQMRMGVGGGGSLLGLADGG